MGVLSATTGIPQRRSKKAVHSWKEGHLCTPNADPVRFASPPADSSIGLGNIGTSFGADTQAPGEGPLEESVNWPVEQLTNQVCQSLCHRCIYCSDWRILRISQAYKKQRNPHTQMRKFMSRARNPPRPSQRQPQDLQLLKVLTIIDIHREL